MWASDGNYGTAVGGVCGFLFVSVFNGVVCKLGMRKITLLTTQLARVRELEVEAEKETGDMRHTTSSESAHDELVRVTSSLSKSLGHGGAGLVASRNSKQGLWAQVRVRLKDFSDLEVDSDDDGDGDVTKKTE